MQREKGYRKLNNSGKCVQGFVDGVKKWIGEAHVCSDIRMVREYIKCNMHRVQVNVVLH